jgi:ferredoxin
MKRLSGILFILTLLAMLSVNSCQQTGTLYSINQDSCTLCKECIKVCGYNAIYMVKSENDRDTLIIDPNKCVGCGECTIACPVDAITSASAKVDVDD